MNKLFVVSLDDVIEHVDARDEAEAKQFFIENKGVPSADHDYVRVVKDVPKCAGCGRDEELAGLLTGTEFPLCDACEEECRVLAAQFVKWG